jgi:RNA polymerase sigma factor for flagellar operon FliA
MNKLVAYQQGASDLSVEELREHLPLVKRIALHLAARLPASLDLDDLIQTGLIALLHARESYDPAQGATFSTYAGIRIKGAMLDELRQSDWLPRSVQRGYRRVAEAVELATARLGRVPSESEIAAELQMELSEYQQLAGQLARGRMVCLQDDNDVLAAEFASGPQDQQQEQRLRLAVVDAIEALPERERMVMSLYYSEEMNLKEIGALLGVTESRVSQLHGQALARLRVALTSWAS